MRNPVLMGDTVKTYYPPVWDLYPFDKVQGFDTWPLYPYGENWDGWSKTQPEHRHSLIDITAVDDQYGRELCVQCGAIFVEKGNGA